MLNKILNHNDLNSFKDYILKNNLKRYPDVLWDKDDAILKWVSILKNIEELNIKNGEVCDIGSGEAILSSILCETNNKVVAIDHDRSPKYPKQNLLNLKTNFLEFNKNDTYFFDLFIDSCSVVHFDYSFTEIIPNNGCFLVGKQIYNLLKPKGYFLTSTDFCEKNMNGEFLNIANIISIYEKCGLTLVEKFDNDFTNAVEIHYNNMILNIATLAFQKK